MNCVYFACRTCQTYIDAGYRWAYCTLEKPGIVRSNEPLRPDAVLAALEYWAVSGGGWPTLKHLELVRAFLLEHAAHGVIYGEDEHFLPELDSEAILDWMEMGAQAEPTVRGLAASCDFLGWDDVLARHRDTSFTYWLRDPHLRELARQKFEKLRQSEHTMRLPAPDEIAVDSLDGRYAIEHFHGKTLEEAETLFDRSALTYTEDLMWMEPVGFRFYVRAAIRYGLSEQAAGDSSILDGLTTAISSQHERAPEELVPCARLVADFCVAVLQQWEHYEINPVIYVGLREQYQKMAELFAGIARKYEEA